MSLPCKVYIGLVVLAGTGLLALSAYTWQTADLVRFLSILTIALLSSTFKISLPGITGTMSVNFLFVLTGILNLSFSETVTIGSSAILVQCFWKTKTSPKLVQIAFNVTSVALSIAATYYTYHFLWKGMIDYGLVIPLGFSACIYFITNTLSIAFVIALVEGKSVRKVWRECYFWSFPYYIIGASIVGLISLSSHYLGWPATLLILPVVYFIYSSYHSYLGKLDVEKNHARDMADLHLRTIEALALAIDAKDHSTHGHLRRVQVYAWEIGKELGLQEDDLEALRAAALLHDIGKLAIPEHIISKPGKLTSAEFDKMKIHPLVGAEILERVQFPYPVVPTVRAHHEKWDGNGYPYGLKGEEIPLGARILSVVDCLDAMASDRPYRRALPLEQAMQYVASQKGICFDPRVVEILERRHVELEQLAHVCLDEYCNLSTGLKVKAGAVPSAGFEKSAAAPGSAFDGGSVDFLSSIAAAREEAQVLYELAKDLGNSLRLDETLSVLAVRLKKIVPYDSIAIYIRSEEHLTAEFVNGEDFRFFSSLKIPLGQGLSGWVAQMQKPILNGDPSVEASYLNDPCKKSLLDSGLAVPLEGLNETVGVLTLYRAGKDAFTRDHLRVLQAVSPKIARSIENALKYRLAEKSATTDELTGLPNARSLFLYLDKEIARCDRLNTSLSVLVCDLDNFKLINDYYGHLEGNKVLKQVAQGIRNGCRNYDYAARMGGDEFVIVLPGTDWAHVESVMKRLGDMTLNIGKHLCGKNLLSMSIGAAYYPENASNAEELLSTADRAMYVIKDQHHALAEAALTSVIPDGSSRLTVESAVVPSGYSWRKESDFVSSFIL